MEHLKQLPGGKSNGSDMIFNETHIIKCKDCKVKMKIKW